MKYEKLGILTFGIVLISLAYAQVPSFNQFYGFVVDTNGTMIPQSIAISAYMNGSLAGSGISTTDGTYGSTELFFVEGLSNQNGEVVSFYLDAYFAGNQTFQQEQITNLNLILNFSAPIFCVDNDGDTYNATGGPCGPVDCDDNIFEVNPGAGEVCSTSYDDNCDGSVNEGCGSTSGTGSGSTSSGGVTTTFNLNPTQLSVVLFQGETRQVSFTVSDDGLGPTTLVITSDIGMVQGKEVLLSAGGSVNVNLDITADANQELDVYSGHIYVVSGAIRKEILLSIQVVSNESLFDIVLTLPEESNYILPGHRINATFILTKLTQDNTENVLVKYTIKNEDDEILLSEEETRIITSQETYTKSFLIPTGTKYGNYLMYAQILYDDKTASASSWFKIGTRKIDNLRWIIILSILFLAIVVIIILLIVHYKKQKLVEQGQIQFKPTQSIRH